MDPAPVGSGTPLPAFFTSSTFPRRGAALLHMRRPRARLLQSGRHRLPRAPLTQPAPRRRIIWLLCRSQAPVGGGQASGAHRLHPGPIREHALARRLLRLRRPRLHHSYFEDWVRFYS